MGLSLNLRNLPVLSRSLLAKLHIPSFTLDFFPYPFPALISLRRTPNGRISGRFALNILLTDDDTLSLAIHFWSPESSISRAQFFRFQRYM